MPFLEFTTIRYRLLLYSSLDLHQPLLVTLWKGSLYDSLWFCYLYVSVEFVLLQLTFYLPFSPLRNTLLVIFIKNSLKTISVRVGHLSFSLSLILFPLSLVNGSIGIGVFAVSLLLVQKKLSFVQIARWILDASFALDQPFFHLAYIRKVLGYDFRLSIKVTLYKFSSVDISIFEGKFTLPLHLVIDKPSFIHSFRMIAPKRESAFTIPQSLLDLSFVGDSLSILYLAPPLCVSILEVSCDGELTKGVN